PRWPRRRSPGPVEWRSVSACRTGPCRDEPPGQGDPSGANGRHPRIRFASALARHSTASPTSPPMPIGFSRGEGQPEWFGYPSLLEQNPSTRVTILPILPERKLTFHSSFGEVDMRLPQALL